MALAKNPRGRELAARNTGRPALGTPLFIFFCIRTAAHPIAEPPASRGDANAKCANVLCTKKADDRSCVCGCKWCNRCYAITMTVLTLDGAAHAGRPIMKWVCSSVECAKMAVHRLCLAEFRPPRVISHGGVLGWTRMTMRYEHGDYVQYDGRTSTFADIVRVIADDIFDDRPRGEFMSSHTRSVNRHIDVDRFLKSESEDEAEGVDESVEANDPPSYSASAPSPPSPSSSSPPHLPLPVEATDPPPPYSSFAPLSSSPHSQPSPPQAMSHSVSPPPYCFSFP